MNKNEIRGDNDSLSMDLEQHEQKQRQTQRRIPTLRFPGFTGPWEQRKFGDVVFSFEYGLNAAAKEYDGTNKYIRITDIDDNTHEFLVDGLTSPDINLADVENYKLAEGDILFARTGASVGKSYIYKDSDGLVYYAGFLIRARIRKEYDAKFVFQNTLTNRYNKYITVTSQRSGQPGVNAHEYSEFEIQIPERKEQAKIGAYFSNIDNFITLHQHKLNILKQYKIGVETRLFSEISTTKKIKDIIEILPKTNHPASEGLKNGNYRFYTNNSTERLYSNKLDYDVEAIISNTGGYANFEYNKGKFSAMADCMCFSTKENTKYIYYILDYLTDKIFFYGFQGNGLKHLNKSWFANLDISVPDINKQNEIAYILSEIDMLLEKETYILIRLKLLKQGLLQQMFI